MKVFELLFEIELDIRSFQNYQNLQLSCGLPLNPSLAQHASKKPAVSGTTSFLNRTVNFPIGILSAVQQDFDKKKLLESYYIEMNCQNMLIIQYKTTITG